MLKFCSLVNQNRKEPVRLGSAWVLKSRRFLARSELLQTVSTRKALILKISIRPLSTHNYLTTIILFLIVFLSLSIQGLVRNRFSFRPQASFMVSVDKAMRC